MAKLFTTIWESHDKASGLVSRTATTADTRTFLGLDSRRETFDRWARRAKVGNVLMLGGMAVVRTDDMKRTPPQKRPW